MSEVNKAVFLSYTSDDKAVALAVCEALREGGVEVWMDQSELQGGDAWDAHIRRQIQECALIMPIISARTQARHEGYFRLEWKLADERSHLVAEGKPLIVPVVADDTQQKDALVPKSFLTVQWSRLPHGHVPPAFVTRVRRLLGLEPTGNASPTQPPMVPGAPAVGVELLEPAVSGAAQPMIRIERIQVPFWRRLLALSAILGLGILLGVLAVWRLKPAPPVSPKLLNRFVHDLPRDLAFRNTGRPVIALSPDGRSIAYNTTAGLMLRTMGETDGQVIRGTEENLTNPVFSPDGQWVVYCAGTQLKKIAVSGGAPVSIATVENPRGISWEADGTILYGQPDGIWRVRDTGGKPEKLIDAASGGLLSAPQLLPGGKSLLFESFTNNNQWQVEVATLPSGERKVVVPGGLAPRYLPDSNHLLYLAGSTLFGVAFDPERQTTTGGPVSLIEDVRETGANVAANLKMANYAVARDGTLVYLAGSAAYPRTLVWVDRQGTEEPLKVPPDPSYLYPRISPDGRRLAINAVPQFGRSGRSDEIYVWDFAAETLTPLALGGPVGRQPIWSPDGSRVIFNRGDGKLSVKLANNTRPPEVFVDSFEGGAAEVWPQFFSPDGRSVVFSVPGKTDIGMIALEGPARPIWLLKEAYTEQGAVLSPDGKWMAYYSNASLGRNEVYVSPFPNVAGDRVQVSNEGGAKPLWSRDGKELFYVGGTGLQPWRLMAAAVQSEGERLTVTARNPVWNQTPVAAKYINSASLRNYDISPIDGRFLMLKELRPDAGGEAPEQIFIVQNWTDELKRRVPAAK